MHARSSLVIRILGTVAVLALVVGAALVVFSGDDSKRLTAQFPRTVSLYAGSDVRVLGVKIGTVDSVTPAGTEVRVEMSYDGQYDLPDDAKAVIVSPSIVGDRFVQITPAYTGGRALADGAVLGTDRTSTPLELDEIYSSLNDLSVALGPDGVNAPGTEGEGALTRLLESTSANFGGQGEQFNETIGNLGRLTTTLDNNKDELFGATRQTQEFISTLARNDQTVRDFNDSLAAAADLLEGERQDLALALRNLGTAMTEVRTFVRDNKDSLSTNIKGLNRVSRILVKRRAELDETLRVAPAALNNLGLAYNESTGTLDTRANLGENIENLISNPKSVLCSILGAAPGGAEACDALPLPRAAALEGGQRPAARDVQYVDRTLGGLVEVDR
ncbi:MCE family protein [Alteromonas gracilis]